MTQKRAVRMLVPERLRRAAYERLRARQRRLRPLRLSNVLENHLRYEGELYEPVRYADCLREGKRDWTQRWSMISQVLHQYDAGSILDIGCAEGWFLRRAAEEFGCFALGIEVDDRRLFRGEVSRLVDESERHAIMKAQLTPASILRLPTVDVVLCLSVVHHVVRAEGVEGGRAFLRSVATRARKALVFEMGCREEHEMSWKEIMPEMPEGQDRFMIEYLRSAGFHNVRVLGATPSLRHEATRSLLVAEPCDRQLASREAEAQTVTEKL